ncbi:MAG: LmeA family phospholipid-binding protein [Waterburya sp.]
MINKLLSTAVKLYLRSQITQSEALQVTILGKNRQILQGYIPQVLLTCNRAVYQGLFLQQVEVKGTNIGFNLPEVLNKKPLQLLEPIVVDVKVSLDTTDLQASLASPILQSGLNDLWQMILSVQSTGNLSTKLVNSRIEWQKIAITDDKLNLVGIYQDIEDKIREIKISTVISLFDRHILNLYPIKISNTFGNSQEFEQPLQIDLGKEVQIEQLVIVSPKILCVGKITIKPN